MNVPSVHGCLLGGALGDSLGLPAENLNAKRIAKLWPGPLRHRFYGRRGMVSDDTEHALMTLLSLYESEGSPEKFARILAKRLRWWLAGVPAGVGFATARSILKLWCGVKPERSGVWSAGNGPMMRAPVIGAVFHDDVERRKIFVEASTRITHSDPRALEAGIMIGEAAAMAVKGVSDASEILDRLETLVESEEMRSRFPQLKEALRTSEEVGKYADKIGRRRGFVSGFAPDSVAVALYAWLRHRGDFRTTVGSLVSAGGDTDTVAFIGGALAGIDGGVEGMPREWIEGLQDWPINAGLLADASAGRAVRYPVWPLSLVRNSLFLTIVIGHVVRRALPPY